MAPLARKIRPVVEVPFATKYSLLQRYALLSSHPRKIFFDAAVGVWVVNSLWHGRWGAALTLYVMGKAASLIIVSDADYTRIAETTYGKMALLHVRSSNLFFHLVGFGFLIHGLLTHTTQSILIGVTSILVGHWVGWAKVHPCFKSK
jgi:hypothetical protein